MNKIYGYNLRVIDSQNCRYADYDVVSVYYLREGKHNGSENVNIPLPHLKKLSLKSKSWVAQCEGC